MLDRPVDAPRRHRAARSAGGSLPNSTAAVRHDWQRAEVQEIYRMPLLELVARANQVHRQFHDPREMQVCKLVSIKTGGCPEDCGYCAQSAHYATGVEPQSLLEGDQVLQIARKAQKNGISRVCMGAAWREVRDNDQFERVLGMVREVTDLGLEVCCTLGMLTEAQAKRLEEAGLHAYNHNLDTSARFYETIITSRKYQDRLDTLGQVRKTGITVCCGGILGMGENEEDRLALLQTLATLDPHPESVPINLLSKVAGTPLETAPDVAFDDVLRAIATARVLMPRSVVRLSAGRSRLSEAEQALCFLAGANSIFSSETRTMLTAAVPSPDYETDQRLLARWGMVMRPPFKDGRKPRASSAAHGRTASTARA